MCFDCGCCDEEDQEITEKCGECLDRESCDLYLECIDDMQRVCDNWDDPMYEEWAWAREFADPGSGSALRAETEDNPRIHPCPNCGEPNRLTPKDVALGYQCDACADAIERGY
jgi:hypothetical protein